MTIVDLAPRGKGVSVFAVDPGQTTGWAWCLLGHKEIRERGVEGSIAAALRARSGTQLADRRWAWGQIPCHYTGGTEAIGVDEWQAAEQLISTMEMCGEMGDRISGGAVPAITAVVVEDFVLRQRTMTRDLLSPVRLTAAFYVLMCQHRWRFSVHLQSASDKATINDERLKRLGLWAKGEQHARDANRHLALYLRKRRTGL